MTSSKRVRVVVSGATGLVGSGLVQVLRTSGYQVQRLVRGGGSEPGDVLWDPAGATLDGADLEGASAVVHLAGDNVGSGRWTATKKARILGSRVQGTRLLVDVLGSLRDPPRILISASAVGYYGDRADESLEEESPPGQGFLSEVCQAWETEAAHAADHGIRVARYRFGLVLTTHGGALARMLPLFRWGLGGRLGSGRQYQSWITREDAVRAIVHGIENGDIRGPVNVVSPHPVTNAEFTRTLARVLRRPALLPAPAFALRLGVGEFGRDLVFSQRVTPGLLMRTGFDFEHPHLEPALRGLLTGEQR